MIIKEYIKEINKQCNATILFLNTYKFGALEYIIVKHLQKYCDEFSYRYNLIHLLDVERFSYALVNAKHRVSYKELIGKSKSNSQ